MPLRLVLAADFPLPGHMPHGGVEVVVHTLVGGFSRREDVEVHVITTHRAVRRACAVRIAPNATAHYLPQFGHLELPTLFLHDRIVLGRALRSLRPDVVHAQNLGRYAYVCGALGYGYALTLHGITSIEEHIVAPAGFRRRIRQALLERVEASSMRGAAAIVANSTYVLDRLPAGFSGRTVCIPNPVDPLFFAAESTPPEAGRVVWVGRFSRLKGIDVLLRAWQRVRRAVPGARLRLIGAPGDAEYAAELQPLMRGAGRDGGIDVSGPVYGEALRAEYAAAVALVLPSRQENAPVVIGEAMAVGRPVVASRVGGVADMVEDGQTGWLCAPDDEADLADALVRVLRDQAAQRRMGRSARARAEARVRLEPIVDRHVELYRQLRA